MIPLVRDRSTGAVPSAFRGNKPIERLVDLMKEVRDLLAAGEEVKLDFDSKWGVTKDQLLLETHQKCAYCEAPTSLVAYGDVEHYRPKSKYWWLAYVYDNYLASCQLCNQRFKSDLFEFAGPEMPGPAITATMSDADLQALAPTSIPEPLDLPAVGAFVTAHRDEDQLIPNPYIDDPATVFAWEALDGIGEVEAVPIPGDAASAAKVDAAERIYGINRLELKRHRYGKYRDYTVFRQVVQDTGTALPLRQTCFDLVESMKQPESAFSGMIRFFDDQMGPLAPP